jgi:undecaprenyl-diphosphatase
LLNRVVKAALFSAWPVLVALAAGGVWMILLDRRDRRGVEDVAAISWRTALGIGLFQTLALWPGTSRSMVTIGGGMVLGLRATAAAEFSFLLGVLTLGAACLHDAASGGAAMVAQLGPGAMALGFAVATVSAALAVRWLVSFLTRHGLAPFGWYRLALSAVLAALIASGVVHVG